ncbi:MAG: sigma-70 family RNA polymerase sigma factor [Isosphaeraceae bacterium]
MDDDTPSTCLTLLARLASGEQDADAWERFVRLYAPPLLKWCRSYRLQEADGLDVTQELLVTLYRKVGRFRDEPPQRFRGWLRTVVHATWCDWVERRTSWARAGGGNGLGPIGEPVARDELADLIERRHDQERFDLAAGRVRARVSERTWDAFRLIAVEGLSGQEAADRLGMKLGSTFAAKAKVQRLIRDEVAALEEGDA